MTLRISTQTRLWISRLSFAVAAMALLFVFPLCHCPRYYVLLSLAGLIPLLSGPRLYRWSGAALVAVALSFAVAERRAASEQAALSDRTRAEAENDRR